MSVLPPRCLVWCCPLLFPSSPPSVPSHVACRWLWSERLGHALSDLAIEYHPLAESELINCTEKHFAKAERLHADLEKLVQQRRVDITASRRRMNNLVRELKAMNWVWSRGTDRLFGWQHDLELRAMLEEVCPRPPSLALPCLALPARTGLPARVRGVSYTLHALMYVPVGLWAPLLVALILILLYHSCPCPHSECIIR